MLTGRRISREDGNAEGVDGRRRLDPRGCAARSTKQPCGLPSAAPFRGREASAKRQSCAVQTKRSVVCIRTSALLGLILIIDK